MLGYLRAGGSADQYSPEQSARELVLAQAEALGDPAVPGPQHDAILYWLEKAQQRWSQQYPLEPQLERIVDQLIKSTQ